MGVRVHPSPAVTSKHTLTSEQLAEVGRALATPAVADVLPLSVIVRLHAAQRAGLTGSFTLHLTQGSIASCEVRETFRVDRGKRSPEDGP